MPTTFRSALVSGLITILEAQITATPTLLRKAYRSFPGGFTETPAAFIGPRNETIAHTSGTRRRTFPGLSVTVVDVYRPETEEDNLDQLVDALVDRFTANPSAISAADSILEMSGVEDGELTIGGEGMPSVTYRTVTLTFANTFITEGRS